MYVCVYIYMDMSQNWVPDNPLVNKLNHMLTYQHSNLRGVCVCMYIYMSMCRKIYLVCLMFRRTISYVSIYVHIYVYIYIFILHISYTSLIHTPIIYLFIYILIHLWRFPKIEVPPRSSILDWEFPLETI